MQRSRLRHGAFSFFLLQLLDFHLLTPTDRLLQHCSGLLCVPDRNMNSCGGCKKSIKGGSVRCDLCDQWFDFKCSGTDQATLDFLGSSSG